MKAMLAVGVAAVVLFPAPVLALPDGTEVQAYETGLAFPVDMAWVKGTKKIFFTEKDSGNIRVLNKGKLLATSCRNLDVDNSGERGALGIALDPDYQDNHRLYVYYTNRDPLENRVTRFKVKNNRCKNPTNIITGISSASGYHNGGQLEFVRGKLFVTTGEGHDPSEAQDTGNRLGKVLRYTPGGKIPDGNPFSTADSKSSVWSYGHRNGFGLAHKPGTNLLYQTENGPSCDDELNLIKKGRNYGWGSGYTCGTKGVGPDPKGPMKRWSSVIAPTDPTWYEGKLDALDKDLYMGDYNNGHLHRLVIKGDGTKFKKDRIIYRSGDSIQDVAEGPGGWLYFATTTGIFRIVET